jgi:hypothetical protein
MNIVRRTLTATAIIASTFFTAGCYEVHIVADIDAAGVVTAGSLDMSMAKETFDGLAGMGGDASPGGLEGFEALISESSEDESSPAAGEFFNACTYSETTVDSTEYYSAECAFDEADLDEAVTVDQLLGLTNGKTVVTNGALTITGSMPDDSDEDDSSSLGMAASMGFKMDTTLHFENNVVSVEGEGVEIDDADPSTVIVDHLAATASDVSIVVEVPSDNTVLYIAGGAGAVLVGMIVWLVLVNRKKKTA